MKYKPFLSSLFLLLIVIQHSPAQEASHIRNPMFVGARPMGMGDTFVAVANDANAIYWNPAGMAFLDRYEIQFMHANLFNSSIKNNYVAAMLPGLPFLPGSDKLAYGIDWFSINFGDAELEHSQNDISFALAYRPLKNFAIGGKVKYLYNSTSLDEILEAKATGWGLDFGAFCSPLKKIKLGVMIHDAFDTRIHYKNGGSEILFFRNIRYGLSYELNDLFIFKNPLIALDIDDRFHIGAETWLQHIIGLRAGIQKDISENSEYEITFSFGAGIHYKFLQFDYALTNSPFLENTNRFSLGFNFNLPASPIKIEQVEVKDIFSSQYIHQETDTCAVIDLVYDGQKAMDCKVTLKEKKYGITAEKSVKFDPAIETTKQVLLYPNLPHRLLETSPADITLTHAVIAVEPKTVIATKKDEMISPSFLVYGMNNIDWSIGTEQAAAFITPNDKSIEQLTLKIQELYHQFAGQSIINRNVSLAALAFSILGQYGIRYKVDPYTPFSDYDKAVDTIQYPYQLLQKKQGDCDDTTILFASVLENLGIRTALVDVPRHIFMIFDTGIHERHRLTCCLPPTEYIVFDHHIWLPIETTMYGKSFRDAWLEGAREYARFNEEKLTCIVDVHQAWLEYRPLNLNNQPVPINMPPTLNLQRDYSDVLKNYEQTRDQFLMENYYIPLQNNPNDYEKQNELAYILYLSGKRDQASEQFRQLLKSYENETR